MFFGVGQECGYCGGEFAVGDYAAGLAVADYGRRPAVWSNYCGDSAGEGFKDYVAEGIGVGGENEEVHVGVGGGERFALEDAGDFCARHAVAQPLFFCAVADD